MATLDATPGGASSNAYCTRAEATAYHETRLSSSVWTSASDANKDIAIMMATRLLDEMYEWANFPTTGTQRLLWPRTGMVDVNEWNYIADNVIPERLKEATAEFARQLLAGDRTADSDIETQGITSLTAGPVSLSFKENVRAKVVPDAVYHLIPRHWGRLRRRGGATLQLVRG